MVQAIAAEMNMEFGGAVVSTSQKTFTTRLTSKLLLSILTTSSTCGEKWDAEVSNYFYLINKFN
jgi:hypothetical protein